jgi:hypothetical protein
LTQQAVAQDVAVKIVCDKLQHRENLSKPRKPGQKPHKNMIQKNC